MKEKSSSTDLEHHFFTDITRKRRADLRSPTVQDEWEKTFDALQDVVTILSPDYRIIRANKATCTTFGMGYDELYDKYCYEVFHNRSLPCDQCPIGRSTPKNTTETGMVYNSRVDKTFEVTSLPVLDHDNEVNFFVHTARDITQKLIDESERMILSAAMEHITEAVVITDINGTIQYVNPSFTQTTGYSRQEILGEDFKFLNKYDHSDSFFVKMWHTLENGEVWKGQLVSRKKDGTLFGEHATISPIFDNHGQIINYVAVKRDVSKEDLLERQLHQAMKMEAVGTLAGGIAHDFNNILSAMIGYAQIAKDSLAKDNPVNEDISQILTAGDRAANLVNQILTFSRKQNQNSFQPLKIQYIVKEVLKLLRSSLPATIKLQENIDNDCGAILADPSQIHQVIMNLCTNARQAIGDKYGTITLELKEHEIRGSQITLDSSSLRSEAYLHLMVRDTGHGLNSEIEKQIFDPFFTTKPKDQGTGLGLSVVHTIVKKHGGEIAVESLVSEGTTFHVYLPIVNENVISEIMIKEQIFRGTERIMVVDDEMVIAQIMQRMLAKLGYRVALYTESLQAVADFRKNPFNFDAIITDMTMPDMTGAELAREVLAIRPDLAIIMTTGYSETIDKEKAQRIGIKEFMLKPVKNLELSAAVRKVLDNG